MKKKAKLLALFLVLAVMLAMGSTALANNYIPLELGVPYYGEGEWFEFTPEVSGNYGFVRIGGSGYVWGTLYDDSMNYVDASMGFDDFYLYTYLEANTTYYLEVGSTGSGAYSLEVVFVHTCNFTIGPYYGSHTSSGHEKIYYCEYDCGASETQDYVNRFGSCQQCTSTCPPHSFNGYRGFEAYHFSGLGHREFYYCSAVNCVETQIIPNAYVSWNLCEECNPPEIVLPGFFKMPSGGSLFITLTFENSGCNVELFGEGLKMEVSGYISVYSGDGSWEDYDYMNLHSMMNYFELTVSGTPGEWYSLIIEADSEIFDIQISF